MALRDPPVMRVEDSPPVRGRDSVHGLPEQSEHSGRGFPCVLVAVSESARDHRSCLESIREHSPADTPISAVDPTTPSLNAAIERSCPLDVVVITQPCRVSAGWLELLRSAAYADTNIASASALADRHTALALEDDDRAGRDLSGLAARVAAHTLRLRPGLLRAVGPCIYVRRDALELVGELDETLPPRAAVEMDLAQRCLLSGLAHVAADDVVVELLDGEPENDRVAERLSARYRYMAAEPLATAPAVLSRALEAAGQPRERLAVTIDARALDGAITGTQVHIVELIRALAGTGALRLRILVRERRIGQEALRLLRSLPGTEMLAEEQIDERTPASTIVHRPQQSFAAEDIELALRLGERLVLSQLDLIAYNNPGYFPDAAAWASFRRASRHGMAAAERVVVFSDHTRRELLASALAEEARIRVVPPGLDHGEVTDPSAPPAIHGGAPGGGSAQEQPPFLLCLGTSFRHKNRLFALRLFDELQRNHSWKGRLVMAGRHIPDGSSLPLEHAFLKGRTQLEEAFLDLGPVTEPERVWLMRNAAALLYPSVYEGFGLVPFESALNGVPCIFAAQSALAETAPPGTATIVPWSAAESAAAASALLSDEGARAQHIDALATAARELTWASAAAAMVGIYRETALAPVRDAATLSRDAVDRERELTAAHRLDVEKLIGEREHVLADYEALRAQAGWGLSLVGPDGKLPEDTQRALLALSSHPSLSGPLLGAIGRIFVLARALSRRARHLLGPR